MTVPSGPFRDWDALGRDVEAVVRGLEPGEFLILDGPDAVYVQTAREADGYWVEAVSGYYRDRPDDELLLRRLLSSGWVLAAEPRQNHGRSEVDAAIVAAVLVAALRVVFQVAETDAVTFSQGRFPSPPDGGLPVAA